MSEDSPTSAPDVAAPTAGDPRPTSAPTPRAGSPVGLDVFREFGLIFRGLAWPIAALAVFCAVKDPILALLKGVAGRASDATKVTVGSFSVEIQQQARELGAPRLAVALGQLSAEAVSILMKTTPRTSYTLVATFSENEKKGYSVPGPERMEGLRELEKRGLARFKQPLDSTFILIGQLGLKTKDAGDGEQALFPSRPLAALEIAKLKEQAYELTSAGAKAQAAIINAVAKELVVQPDGRNVDESSSLKKGLSNKR